MRARNFYLDLLQWQLFSVNLTHWMCDVDIPAHCSWLLFCLFCTCIDREFLIFLSCFLGSGRISMSWSILLADYVAEDKETITLTVGYASFILLYNNFWKRLLDSLHHVLFCVGSDYELLLTCLLRLTEGNRILTCSVALRGYSWTVARQPVSEQ